MAERKGKKKAPSALAGFFLLSGVEVFESGPFENRTCSHSSASGDAADIRAWCASSKPWGHKMRAVLKLVVLACLVGPQQLSAQTELDSFTANEVRQDGKLIGCNVDFVHSGDDLSSGHPVFVVTKGAFGVFAPDDPRRAAWVLQLMPMDATMVNSKLKLALFTPVNAYIVTMDGFSSASKEATRQKCEEGGICLVGQAGLLNIMQDFMLGTQIKIFYKRNKAKMDSEIVLALPSMGSPEHRYTKLFGDCVAALLNPT